MNTSAHILAGSLALALASGCGMSLKKEARRDPQAASAQAEPAAASPAKLAALSNDSVADVVERVMPSVVSISSTRTSKVEAPAPFFNDPLFRRFMPRGGPNQRVERGLGSGVVVAPDTILTNNHVIDGATEITVNTADKHELTAKVVGADPRSDLAVLKLENKTIKLKPITLGASSKLRLGDVVLAIGNPLGVGESVTMGIVSAKGRANVGIADYEDFIQTDAAINPGNSGGALVNLKGELVGINTAILSRSGGSQGIGFAIPSDMARPIMKSLIDNGRVSRGFMGVAIQDIDQDLAQAMGMKSARGVLISNVGNGSPADKAGLKRGDVVLKVAGDAVNSTGDLRNRVAMSGAGNDVTLRVLREGKERDVKITLTEAPEPKLAAANDNASPIPDSQKLDGVGVAELSPAARSQFGIDDSIKSGVVITNIAPTSLAAEAGLRPGDVVLELNKQKVASVSDFKRAWESSKSQLLVLVNRRGNTLYLALRNN